MLAIEVLAVHHADQHAVEVRHEHPPLAVRSMLFASSEAVIDGRTEGAAVSMTSRTGRSGGSCRASGRTTPTTTSPVTTTINEPLGP